MSDERPYINEIREAASPLVQRFALQEVSIRGDARRPTVRFANGRKRVGVEFGVDWNDLRALVTLFHLTPDREFIDLYGPDELKKRTATFNADYLIQLRAGELPRGMGKVRRKAPGEARRCLTEYTEALIAHGSDVMSGNFAVFEDLERMRARIIEELRGSSQ